MTCIHIYMASHDKAVRLVAVVVAVVKSKDPYC